MTDSDELAKEKESVINRCLDDEHVLIHLDSRKKGVEIPSSLMNQPMITLKLSRLFKGGVEVQPDKIIADLRFPHGYSLCTIPLKAVWGFTDAKGQNTIWPESAPDEVLLQQKFTAQDNKTKKAQTKKSKAPAGLHLRRVK